MSYKYGVGRGLIDDYLAGERKKDWVEVGCELGYFRIANVLVWYFSSSHASARIVQGTDSRMGQTSECQMVCLEGAIDGRAPKNREGIKEAEAERIFSLLRDLG